MNISLINIFLVNVALFVLVKFVLLPFTNEAVKRDKSQFSLSKNITRNIVDFLGLLLLLTSVSSGLSWLLVEWINSKGGATLQEVQNSLGAVKKIESMTSVFANKWGVFSSILLIISLLIITCNQTKKTFEKRLKKALSKELKKLEKKYKKGNWEEIPPTEEMKKVYVVLDEYSAKIDEIRKNSDSEEDLFRLNALLENRDKLIFYLQQLDINRRIDIKLKEKAPGKPKTVLEKVLRFFVSNGLINTLKKSSSTLFLVGALLLIPSLLSVASFVVSDEAKSRVASLGIQLESIELELRTEELSTAYQEIVHSDNKENSITEEDEMVLNELSQNFENNILEVRITGNRINHSPKNQAISNFSVRNAILDEFKASGAKVHHSKPLPEMVNQLVDLEKNSIKTEQPITDIGKRIKEDLRLLARTNGSLWSHLKKLTVEATNSFQTPVAARSVKGMVISNVVGQIAQGVESKGVVGRLTSQLSEIPSDVAEQVYLNESKQYILTLAKAKHINDVIEKIGSLQHNPMPAKDLKILNELISKAHKEGILSDSLFENHVSLSRPEESHVKLKESQHTVRRIAQVNKSAATHNFADALASFGDFFPGFIGEEKQTSKGKLTSASANTQSPSSSRNAHSRSRNYFKLRGFSRIGGVLIGRMPETEKVIDLVDIEWTFQSGKVIVNLTKKNGRVINLGAFNPSVLFLALGYAADGRVTAVTMVSAEPLRDLKILTHPVLVDTNLGCRVIKLDQIADFITSENPEIQELRRDENLKIQNLESLYNYAWMTRLIQTSKNNKEIERLFSDQLAHLKVSLEYHSNVVEEIISSKKIDFKFFQSKKDYYDQKLVQSIKDCFGSSDFRQCIENDAPVYLSRKDKNLFIAPPQTVEWSGVRERGYELNDNLDFLLANHHDNLWPLRFMVQRVFTNEPGFTSEGENYYDPEPWEFESVNEALMREIHKAVVINPDLEDLIGDIREFVILQRLFRLALNNKFSSQFPTYKLAKLASESKPYSTGYNRTLRWLPKPIDWIERDSMYIKDPEQRKEVIALKKQLRNELGIYKDEIQINENPEEFCNRP